MPPGVFYAGHDADVEWTLQGGTMKTQPARNWVLNITGMIKPVHNSRDGRKRIPGLPDMANGTMSLVYDAGVPMPYIGQVGAAKFYINKANNIFWAMQIIIESVSPAAEFESEIVYPITFSLESGTITPPVGLVETP